MFKSKRFPPVPEWQPDHPADIDRIVTTFSYYTDKKRAFVVFKHGTCIPVDAGSSTLEADAIEVLRDLFHQHPDFNPLSMDDGHWLVTYSDRAFSVAFSDELAELWPLIEERHLDALAEDEVLLNAEQQPNTFDQRGKIGLFARTFWFLDAQSPEVVRIVAPESPTP